MENNFLFINVTGKNTGTEVRINVANCTKYRTNDGGTGFYTENDNSHPYMIAKESPEQVDALIRQAVEDARYSLEP